MVQNAQSWHDLTTRFHNWSQESCARSWLNLVIIVQELGPGQVFSVIFPRFLQEAFEFLVHDSWHDPILRVQDPWYESWTWPNKNSGLGCSNKTNRKFKLVLHIFDPLKTRKTIRWIWWYSTKFLKTKTNSGFYCYFFVDMNVKAQALDLSKQKYRIDRLIPIKLFPSRGFDLKL